MKPILMSSVIVGAAVIMLIILPQFWSAYPCKPLCSSVESDADSIASAIADYFAVPGRTEVKPGDLNRWFQTENPWTIRQCGDAIYIYVYDLNEDCPIEYQNNNPGWNSSIYTKIME